MVGCGRFCQVENTLKARLLSSIGQQAGRRNKPYVHAYGWSRATQMQGHGCSTCTRSHGFCPGIIKRKSRERRRRSLPSAPARQRGRPAGHLWGGWRSLSKGAGSYLPAICWAHLRQWNSLQSMPFPVCPTLSPSPQQDLLWTMYWQSALNKIWKQKPKLSKTSKTSLHETFKSDFFGDCWLIADTKE